jgi:hypothetical protein
MQKANSESLTIINQEWFSFTLPGQWSEMVASDKSKFTYLSRDESKQLTVSLFSWESGTTIEQRKASMERMVTGLQQVDKDVINLSPIEYMQAEDMLATRYTGYDESHERRFAGLMLGNLEILVNLYFETLGLSSTSEFENMARTLFNSIKLGKKDI